jgi:GlpG protein
MQLMTLSEKRPALAFSDYLRAQGIPNRVEAAEGGFAIVLAQAEQGERALQEAQEFVAHPQDPKYWQASWHSGEVQKEAVYAAGEPATEAWWQRAGWVTRSIAALCLLVFAGLLLVPRATFGLLHFPEGISLAAVHGEWWRLLTPALLHFGFLHIAFNLLWWWELGGLVEKHQSPARLLALTFVIALVSNAAQFLVYGPNFGGLSAVVYGLLGYLWLYPVIDPRVPFRLRGAIVAFMLGWLALGYTGIPDAVLGISISNHGHLAGLLVGGGLGLLLGLVNRRGPSAPGAD